MKNIPPRTEAAGWSYRSRTVALRLMYLQVELDNLSWIANQNAMSPVRDQKSWCLLNLLEVML